MSNSFSREISIHCGDCEETNINLFQSLPLPICYLKKNDLCLFMDR